MPGTPVHPTNIQKCYMPFFDKHTVLARYNCIKQVSPAEQRQSKWFYCIYSSFMVKKCYSISKMTFDVWAPSEMTTGCYKQFCCLQIPGRPRKLPIARSPGLIVYEMSGVCPGGGCSRPELTRTLCTMTLWKIFAVDTQFKQLRKRSLKKIQASAGFEPVTSAIPVQCSTNWAMKP